jgi:hypothetical protein
MLMICYDEVAESPLWAVVNLTIKMGSIFASGSYILKYAISQLSPIAATGMLTHPRFQSS